MLMRPNPLENAVAGVVGGVPPVSGSAREPTADERASVERIMMHLLSSPGLE